MANEVKIEIDVETAKAIKSIAKLEKEFTDFSKEATKGVDKTTGALEVFQGAISANIVSSVFKGMTTAAIGFGASSVKSAAEIEGLTSQLTTLTGSASDAGAILKDLQQFSASTPFQLPGIAEASKKLLAFQFQQDQIIPKLKELGDVAAGSGADLNDLTLIYGQISAAGKLTGERFNQLKEKAIPIGPAIAKTLGVLESEVQNLVSTGKVGFKEFEQAFSSLNQEGGQFFEGMIRQSKTFDGVMSTVGDNINLLQADFGKGLLPTLKTLGVAFVNLAQDNKELAGEFGAIVDVKLNEFIDGLLNSIVPLGKAVIFVNDVFVGLGTTWDFLLIGLNELGDGVISLVESFLNASKSAQEFLNMDTSGVDSAINSIGLIREENAVFTRETSEGIDKRLAAGDKYAKQIEEISTKVSVAAKKEIAIAREATKVVEEEESKKIQVKKQAAIVEKTEKEKVALKLEELEKANAQKRIDLKANELLALKELELEDSIQKEEERLIKVELDTEQADERLQLLVSRLGQEEAIKSEAEARRLEKEGKVAQAKKKRDTIDLKAKKENIFAFQKFEDLSQKQRVANLQSTFGTIASLTDSNNKALATAGKAAAISQATIDGFAAVQKALASAPPPFNFALAGLVGAATAANVAQIAGVKGFQGGGVVDGVPQDRDNQQVNVASGEVILNRRQQAETLFQIANGQGGDAGGGGGFNISIAAGVGGVSDEQVDSLINQINDRVEFGNQSLGAA